MGETTTNPTDNPNAKLQQNEPTLLDRSCHELINGMESSGSDGGAETNSGSVNRTGLECRSGTILFHVAERVDDSIYLFVSIRPNEWNCLQENPS
jgi:hypothetical protein